jgi:tRNA pseudouridine13 synthase
MKNQWNLAGKIKTFPSDFIVEEIPLYEPCGEGEHLYITIRKTKMSHDECLRKIAKHFGVSIRDIGSAGRKDLQAVTTQTFSVYLRGKKPEVPQKIGNIDVLNNSYHTNKLRLGHLLGNKFSIRVREVEEEVLPLVQERIRTIEEEGMPNFFGQQRFGNVGNNHKLGLLLIKEDWTNLVSSLLYGDEAHNEFAKAGEYKQALNTWPFGQPAERNVLEALSEGKTTKQACKRISKTLKKLWVNALQSFLFNKLLTMRIEDESWNTLNVGDLAYKHEGGGRTFEVTVAEKNIALDNRVEAMELSPSGPLWGSKMRLPTGRVLEKEIEVRESLGLDDTHLVTMRKYAKGARRALRVKVKEPKATFSNDEHGDFIELQFGLPSGSYATVAVDFCLGLSSCLKKNS